MFGEASPLTADVSADAASRGRLVVWPRAGPARGAGLGEQNAFVYLGTANLSAFVRGADARAAQPSASRFVG
eukprot:5438910-Prymnesium_polylepis.2